MAERQFHRNDGRIMPIIFGISALFFLILSLVVNGVRGDYEIVAAAESAHTEISLPAESRFSLFVCLPEGRAGEQLSDVEIKPKSGVGAEIVPVIPMPGEESLFIDPRPLELPPDFAAARGLDPHQKCSVSTQLRVVSPDADPGEAVLFEISSQKGALIAAAVSPGTGILYSVLFFLIFLVSIWGAFATGYRRGFPKLPQFGRIDAAAAFGLAMVISYAIMLIISRLPFGSADELIPGYFEVLSLLMTNFLSFMSAFVIVFAFRKVFPHKIEQKLNKERCIERESESAADIMDEPAAPAETAKGRAAQFLAGVHTKRADGSPARKTNYPARAFLCGFGLVLAALFVMSAAPLPGLSTAEMASQYVSSICIMALAAVLAGVAEECVFRGIIQTGFEARPGSRRPALDNMTAVIAATALFITVHVPQSLEHLWALIPIGLFSVTAGLIKIRSGSIFPAILTHMTYNGLLVLPSIFFLLF